MTPDEHRAALQAAIDTVNALVAQARAAGHEVDVYTVLCFDGPNTIAFEMGPVWPVLGDVA